jgi:1,6-anhydro-N-acetylmuramate kinase
LVAATGGQRRSPAPTSGRQAAVEPRASGPAWSQPNATRETIIEGYSAHVREVMADRGLSRRDACASIARRQPLLHEKYIGASNSRRRR